MPSEGLERLLEATAALARVGTEKDAALLAADLAMALLGADRVQVMCAVEPGSLQFASRGQRNLPNTLEDVVVNAATEPSGTALAVRTGRTLFVADARSSPLISPRLGRLIDPTSMVFIPLPGEGGFLGAIVAIWDNAREELDPFSQRAAELLSAEAGRALERTREADRLTRDLIERRVAEAVLRRERAFLDLLKSIAVAANEARTVDEALQRALDDVCAYTGWPVGHVYFPGEAGVFVPSSLWHLEQESLGPFRQVTERTPLATGVGLPGRVVGSGQPAWICDVTTDSNFPRATAADQVGLRAGLAFPVLAGGEVAAVLEFFTSERLEPDETFLELATHLGSQLGRVVERRRAEDALRASEERTRGIIETAGDAFVGTDDGGRVTDWNRQAELIFGWGREEVRGKPVADVIIPDELRSPHRKALHRFVETGKPSILGRRLELEALARDGRRFPVELTVWATRVGRTYGFSAFIHDISDRKRLEAELTHQALHDPLTGQANRTLFLDRMAHALARGERNGDPTTVLFLDLDGFKTVNDSLGHTAGDRLLSAVADRLNDCVRPSDTIARLGGDEFALLLEETGIEGGTRVARRITDTLSSPFLVEGRQVAARASIGIATGHPGQRTADELLRNADLAMYQAKRLGKGRYAVFEASMHAAALDRLELEADLARAIPAGEMVVHYQPIVRLDDASLAGVEALVRWNRPGRGLVSPLQFIPVAEESELIVKIGQQVLEDACHQARAWCADRHPPSPFRLSVNLSARQFGDPGLVADVEGALARSGFDPTWLVLEITESILMEQSDSAMRTIAALKSLGLRLAIDDFGTGYSSLSYLRRFPVDVLKIDKTFVAAVVGGAEDAALPHAIIRLAQTLRLVTVAEGIETADQLARLQELGCDFGQGYLFSPPLPADAMTAWLHTRVSSSPVARS